MIIYVSYPTKRTF